MNKQCIEDYGDTPLAFSIRIKGLQAPPPGNDISACRTVARALEGMQKEALVADSDSGRTWRLVCDEGPYLNGTDLAPPPLAYFSAGMASGFADAVQTRLEHESASYAALTIILDNRYTMVGSALRGTMIAGALPVECFVEADVTGLEQDLETVIREAIAGSPMNSLMREALANSFSLSMNGESQPTGKVKQLEPATADSPILLFKNFQRDESHSPESIGVSKLDETDSVFDQDHGAGAAMKEHQKRELHIRSSLTLDQNGLHSIRVQIFKPVGSVFGFTCERSNGDGDAPSANMLVSAGVAFCFMTQIGRYAGITKKELQDYAVVQDSGFGRVNNECRAIETHVYIESTESLATAQDIVDMSEQTCFLHAACRSMNDIHIQTGDLHA